MSQSIDDRFKAVDLYGHNIAGFLAADDAYKSGEDIVAMLRATGTGKTYLFLQFAYERRRGHILYLTPSEAIIEHIKKVINDNPNLDINRDFPGLQMWTYQHLVSLSKEEIKNIKCDFLVIDEFHHIGAPVWGARIKTLVETHPHMKILGISAYSVRDRGTPYERDMTNPNAEELFSGKVCNTYDICDAIIDGVLPKVVYKSAYPIEKIKREIQDLEKIFLKKNFQNKKRVEDLNTLNTIKKRIAEAPSLPNILRNNIKPTGKYIYFCPPISEQGVNDIETIKKEAFGWFKEFVDAENIVFYTTTSKMGREGKKQREAFYNDVTLDGKSAKNKLQIMFAINQYNEGVHAPNVDGVIMGRATSSDIVFFEQLGRALAVRGDTKKRHEELEKYDISDLLKMCAERGILLSAVTSKEEIIDKLIAPVVIDLTCNIDFIKNLENNLKSKVKELQKKENKTTKKIKIDNAIFDIELENEDIYAVLKSLKEKAKITWEEYYEIAKIYYEYYHDLLVPQHYKTNDGYTRDPDGFYPLGHWIQNQRRNFYKLSSEKQEKLLAIGFVLDAREAKWEEYYKLATAFFKTCGHLIVPSDFKTNDGVVHDSNGAYKLGTWIVNQRINFSRYSKERQEKLLKIGFVLNTLEANWEDKYQRAKNYYEKYGRLPTRSTKEKDNIYLDIAGKEYKLGVWVEQQRINFSKLSKERQEKLLKIGLIINVQEATWEEYYKLATAFFKSHGHLIIPNDFKTNDGIVHDPSGAYKLGTWKAYQRRHFSEYPKERQEKLLRIGFVLNANEAIWEDKYQKAKNYYEKYGRLPKRSAKEKDNIYLDIARKEYNLGVWVEQQRRNFSKLSKERQEKLLKIGLIINVQEVTWEEYYKLATAFFKSHGHLIVPQSFKTNDGVMHTPNGAYKLGTWKAYQRRHFSEYSKERQEKLLKIGFVLNAYGALWEDKYQRAKTYYKKYGHLPTKNAKDNIYIDIAGRKYKLSDWITNQKFNFSKLSSQKQERLLKIGFECPTKIKISYKEQWEIMYNLAKAFYEYYGHLIIPIRYRTSDGVVHDPNGEYYLGQWISNQRAKIDPSSERGKRLLQIGMVFSVKKNNEEIKLLCLDNSINYDKNKHVLEKMSKQELYSKLEFLKSSNLPYVDENGCLIDIFSLSNANMQELYNVSLEELVNKYYLNNSLKKEK